MPEPQELYLELQVRCGRVFLFHLHGVKAGYFIMSRSDTILLEYYLIREYLPEADAILGEIIRTFFIRHALCKSFDALLLSCCMNFQKSISATGILFREYDEKPLPDLPSEIQARLACREDIQTIIQVNEEVFDCPEQVYEWVEMQRVFLFEKESTLVGFGIFSRVMDDRPDFDVGMLVNKPFRGQGYAPLIIQFLIRHCRKNHWRALAGCAIENTASRRSLEKAGFITRYRLLDFVF